MFGVYMIVIIEGMDRCYKDSLIKYIRKHILTSHLTTMIHCASTPTNADKNNWPKHHYESLLEECIDLSENKGWNIILNRSHLGENVYGPIFRDVNSDWVFDLEKDVFGSNTDVRLIAIIDSAENLMKREDGESMYKSINDLEQVRNAFLETFERSHITHKVIHDHSLVRPDAQIQTLIELTKEHLS